MIIEIYLQIEKDVAKERTIRGVEGRKLLRHLGYSVAAVFILFSIFDILDVYFLCFWADAMC